MAPLWQYCFENWPQQLEIGNFRFRKWATFPNWKISLRKHYILFCKRSNQNQSVWIHEVIVKPGDVDLMKGGSSRKVILMENFSGTPWAELKNTWKICHVLIFLPNPGARLFFYQRSNKQHLYLRSEILRSQLYSERMYFGAFANIHTTCCQQSVNALQW